MYESLSKYTKKSDKSHLFSKIFLVSIENIFETRKNRWFQRKEWRIRGLKFILGEGQNIEIWVKEDKNGVGLNGDGMKFSGNIEFHYTQSRILTAEPLPKAAFQIYFPVN